MTRRRIPIRAPALCLAALLAAPVALAPSHAWAGEPTDAAMCPADAEPTLPGAAAIHPRALERLRELQAAVDAGEVVVLDGRGHRYHRERDPLAELAVLEAEARRQRQGR